MTALAMSSFAASTPSTSPPAAVSACWKVGAAFSTSQPLTVASWVMVSLPCVDQRVEDLVRALLEQHGVVVDVRAAVHHDDLRLVDALRVEAVDHGLGLELADVLVVEGHVVAARCRRG